MNARVVAAATAELTRVAKRAAESTEDLESRLNNSMPFGLAKRFVLQSCIYSLSSKADKGASATLRPTDTKADVIAENHVAATNLVEKALNEIEFDKGEKGCT